MKYPSTIKVLLFLMFVLIFGNSAFSQLSGNYTIGAGGDYTTIASSVNALNVTGVNGPVVFNIKPGSYRERVTINSISGASSVNTITFQSETGNRNDVSWNDSVDFTSALVTLNEADYITFKNISFRNGQSLATQYVFYFQGNCNSINIIGNNIVCISRESNGIYYNDASTTNLLIKDNLINARTGINLSSPVISSHTQIIKNKIQRYEGILISKHDSLHIEENEINVNYIDNYVPFPGLYYYNARGIVLQNCNKYLKITKNKIMAYGYFRYNSSKGVEIQNSNCQNTLIANNFIYSVQGEVLKVSNSNNINIYFNTIRGAGEMPYIGPNLSLNSCTNCNVKNNIIGGSGHTQISYTSNSSLSSDFNTYTPSGFIIPAFFNYNGSSYQDIEDYMEASNMDSNSILKPVAFVSGSFHLSGISIGDEDLKGIPISGIIDDIDGNLRNELHPYMGADEVLPVESLIKIIVQGFYDTGNNRLRMRDTVRAYLRNNSSPYAVVDSAKSIIDSLTFTGNFLFANASSGTYYIQLKHRNSIETWSKSPGQNYISGSQLSYDFTTSSSQAFGNNMIQKGTKFCIYGGDVLQDGIIDITDNTMIDNDVFNFISGYVQSDVTGDRYVDLDDQTIADNNAYSLVSVVRP